MSETPLYVHIETAGMCGRCLSGYHVDCIVDDDPDSCECRCRAFVDCATCGKEVVLFADDPDDPTYSHGECCTWGYVDTFDGAIRLDLSGGKP